MHGLLWLPSPLLPSLRSQTGLKAQVSSVPIQRFPTEDSAATEDGAAAPTTQAPEWVGTTLSGLKRFFYKVRMEIRLMEKKQYLKNKIK